MIAVSVIDFERANKFYGETLGLPPEYENEEQVGYRLGETILMLKANSEASPTEAPNPRVMLETENARETEKALRTRDVVISDPVQATTKSIGSEASWTAKGTSFGSAHTPEWSFAIRDGTSY